MSWMGVQLEKKTQHQYLTTMQVSKISNHGNLRKYGSLKGFNQNSQSEKNIILKGRDLDIKVNEQGLDDIP